MKLIITLLASVMTAMAHPVQFDPRDLAPGPPFRVVKFTDPVVRLMQQGMYHDGPDHPHRHHARRSQHKLYDVKPLKVNPVKLSKLHVKPLKSRVNAAKAVQPAARPLNRDRPQIAVHRPQRDRYEKNGILPFLSHDRGSMLPFISPSDEVLPFVHSVLHSGSGFLPFVNAKMQAETKDGVEPTEHETEETNRDTEVTESYTESEESDSETTKSVTFTTRTWFSRKNPPTRKKTKGSSATTRGTTIDPEDSSYYVSCYDILTVPGLPGAPGFPTPDWWKYRNFAALYNQFAVAFGLDAEQEYQMKVYGQIRPIPRPQKAIPFRKPLRSKTWKPK